MLIFEKLMPNGESSSFAIVRPNLAQLVCQDKENAQLSKMIADLGVQGLAVAFIFSQDPGDILHPKRKRLK